VYFRWNDACSAPAGYFRLGVENVALLGINLRVLRVYLELALPSFLDLYVRRGTASSHIRMIVFMFSVERYG